MYRRVTIFIFVFATIQNVSPNFLSDDNIMSGIMFPERITAIEGSDISLKLVNPFPVPQRCIYRVPQTSRPNEIGDDPHVVGWESQLCGVVVKNISKADEGIWSLSSTRDNDFIRGVLLVTVLPKMTDPEAKEEMEDLDYCVVSRPNEIGYPQIGKCMIPQDSPGDWTLYKGIHGQNKEVVEEVFYEPLGKV